MLSFFAWPKLILKKNTSPWLPKDYSSGAQWLIWWSIYLRLGIEGLVVWDSPSAESMSLTLCLLLSTGSTQEDRKSSDITDKLLTVM